MIREIASWLTVRPCTGTDPFTGPTLSPRASACKRPAIWRGVCERPRSASTLDRSTGSAATLPGWGRARRRCARQSAVTILYPRVVVVLRRTSRETTDAHRSMCAAIARIDQPALSPVAISTRSATVNILRTHNPPPDQHRCHDAMTPPTAHQVIKAARARYDRAVASTDAEMLAAHSPEPGTEALLTNADHDEITAQLRTAETTLSAAEAAHKAIPARVPLGELHPGQQVLDVETKLLSHAIRIAAFNTATTLARDIRINTGYARKNHEAHALARQALTQSGDIQPGNGFLTVRLDPMPTARATAAIRELCEHLTTTGTTYPGTNLTLRYEIKNQP